MRIMVHAVGTSPLLMHNPQMVDPQFEINREIKSITDKRKRTAEDLQTIERLEWFGGLYIEPNGDGKPKVVQPTSKLRKATIEAGRIQKLGKHVERALTFEAIHAPLVFDGPHDPEKLWKAGGQYVSRLSVRIGQKRVIRCRPKFFPWALSAAALFLPDVMDLAELTRLVETAGIAIGIGDNRVNGYGRFKGSVEVIS